MRAGARMINPRSRQGTRGNYGNRGRTTKAAPRRMHTDEEVAIGAERSPVFQLVHDRLTDVLRKRHLSPLSTFAAYRENALPPVDLIECQGSHFAGPQSK